MASIDQNQPDARPKRSFLSVDSAGNDEWPHILRVVVYLYCGVVGAAALYLAYRGMVMEKSVFDDIAELIKIGVLPVVTLVVGFYFGSLRR